MKKVNQSVRFVLELTRTQAVLARRFDSGLGGLGLSEFMVLYHLNAAADEQMRRIDLAERIGLTASGVTRLLLPMEKIGLVKSGESEGDARERYVMIASGGRRKLNEAIERMELSLKELIPVEKRDNLKELTEFITELGARTVAR